MSGLEEAVRFASEKIGVLPDRIMQELQRGGVFEQDGETYRNRNTGTGMEKCWIEPIHEAIKAARFISANETIKGLYAYSWPLGEDIIEHHEERTCSAPLIDSIYRKIANLDAKIRYVQRN